MDSQLFDAAPKCNELLEGSRKRLGLTRAKLASLVGVSTEQWRLYETGAKVPPLERLEQIAAQCELDLAELVAIWARESLPQSPRTRAIIRRVDGHSPERRASPFAKDIRRDVDRLVERIRTDLQGFWNRLVVPQGGRHDLRYCRFDDELRFVAMPGMTAVEHRPIGVASEGLSYTSAFVRIPSGWGACHRHPNEEDLIPGTEFFCIVHGSGTAIIEEPTGVSAGWRHLRLEPGCAGLYRGDLTHTFLATGPEPLVVQVVCVPSAPWSGFACEFELTNLDALRGEPRVHAVVKKFVDEGNSQEASDEHGR